MSKSGEEPMPERLTGAAAESEGRNENADRRFAPSNAPAPTARPEGRMQEPIFDVGDVQVFYGEHRAIRDVSLAIARNEITALIGPSGCGKSTFIRCLNRMNDLIPAARVEGQVVYHGEDLYADDIDQRALRRGALWDEVKDRLKTNAFGMSGGQQQRLCIARALATEPDVLLMDEPCSALDPISTGRIEDLMLELKQRYSIVIVTHNMQQAARVSDMTAFFTVELDKEAKHRTGHVVEFAATDRIFTNPEDQRTEDYVTGKF